MPLSLLFVLIYAETLNKFLQMDDIKEVQKKGISMDENKIECTTAFINDNKNLVVVAATTNGEIWQIIKGKKPMLIGEVPLK